MRAYVCVYECICGCMRVCYVRNTCIVTHTPCASLNHQIPTAQRPRQNCVFVCMCVCVRMKDVCVCLCVCVCYVHDTRNVIFTPCASSNHQIPPAQRPRSNCVCVCMCVCLCTREGCECIYVCVCVCYVHSTRIVTLTSCASSKHQIPTTQWLRQN